MTQLTIFTTVSIMEKKVYLLEREKADTVFRAVVGNFSTVLDLLSELDGTDEVIRVYFTNLITNENGKRKNF